VSAWYARAAAVPPETGRARYYQPLLDAVKSDLPAKGVYTAPVPHIRQKDLAETGQRPRSTFNSLFGDADNASGDGRCLARELRVKRPGLAELRSDTNRVARCADEVRIWTFWPFRDGWLAELDQFAEPTRRTAAETLVLMVAEWARRRPEAAVYPAPAPPMAAVEDLVVVSRAAIGPAPALALLTQVVWLALDGRNRRGEDIVDMVHDELMRLAFDAEGGAAAAIDEVTNGVTTLTRIIPTLSPADRDQLAHELGPTFADLMVLLCPPT